MGPFLSTFRLRFALIAAALLSALSAAEATLAAAPLVDAAGDREWPAQLTPVKDRDSVNHRTVRSSDHSSLDDRSPRHQGGDAPAFFRADEDHAVAAVSAAVVAVACTDRPARRLVLTLIDLPPPAR